MMLEGDHERFTSSLAGKRVIIAITASISIYRVPDIIRDLRREGAEVIAGMSREAAELINPEVFKWATGHEVITKISGDIEHINLFQGEKKNTMLLVCPASYNFIGKAASGISDDVPSLFFSYALGNANPTVISPVMHEGMMINPINRGNLEKLVLNGVELVPPRMEADKAKISDSDIIIDYVSRAFYGMPLSGKNILVIGGRGEEEIDPVRKLTNSGTGFTARWFLKNAFRLGANKIYFIGNSSREVPNYVNYIGAYSFDEFRSETENLLGKMKFDAVVNVASLPDFEVVEKFQGKIDSANPVELHLRPHEKLNRIIREKHNGILVVFKLEDRFDEKETLKIFEKIRPDIVVFNPYSSEESPFGSVTNDYILLTGDNIERIGKLSKPEMTMSVLKRFNIPHN